MHSFIMRGATLTENKIIEQLFNMLDLERQPHRPMPMHSNAMYRQPLF